VRARGVVVLDPVADAGPRVIEAAEQRLVQKLVAHAAVEGLADAVLHRLARGDVVPGDPGLGAPGEDGVRGELGAVVADHEIRPAVPSDESFELAHDAPAGDRGVHDRGQAALRRVVDDVEPAQPPPVRELVVDEVEGPAGIRRCGREDRRPRRRRTASPSSR